MSVSPATENVRSRTAVFDLVDVLVADPGAVASPLTAAGAPAAGAVLCLCLCMALPTT